MRSDAIFTTCMLPLCLLSMGKFRAPNIRSISTCFSLLQQLSSPLLSCLCCAQISLSERHHILLLLGEVMGASRNWNVLRGKPDKLPVMVSLASLLS